MAMIFLVVYIYLGYKANNYCRYHLLNQEAILYGDTGNFIVSQVIWAVLLGWATIPIMLFMKATSKYDA